MPIIYRRQEESILMLDRDRVRFNLIFTITLLLLWISNNPGIHEGFSELSGCYIFMIMSQWWISGGGIPVHSYLSYNLPLTSLLVFIPHQSPDHPGPASPLHSPGLFFLFLIWVKTISLSEFLSTWEQMPALWKIILSKQIRSFSWVASFPEELATFLLVMRDKINPALPQVRSGGASCPQSPGRVSPGQVCLIVAEIVQFASSVPPGPARGGREDGVTLIFTRVPSTETNLDTINSMTGQNLTKPVHNQKLNLFLKLENPRRRSLDTAW